MAARRARITTPNFASSGDGFRIYAEKVDQWKDVCVLTKDMHTVRPIGGSGIQFCFLLIVSSLVMTISVCGFAITLNRLYNEI